MRICIRFVHRPLYYCCNVNGRPRNYYECSAGIRSLSKSRCEGDDDKCVWTDCNNFGRAPQIGIKRMCAKLMNKADCHQGNGGRSGCVWQGGLLPEWYYDDEYELSEEDELFTDTAQTTLISLFVSLLTMCTCVFCRYHFGSMLFFFFFDDVSFCFDFCDSD